MPVRSRFPIVAVDIGNNRIKLGWFDSAGQHGLPQPADAMQIAGESPDLDRIAAWLRVFGMVNAAPGFNQLPAVINGFSDLIFELYGPERGDHARSAVGVYKLPLGFAVEVDAIVEIR